MKKSLRFISLLIAVVFMISGAVMVVCHADEAGNQSQQGGSQQQGGDQSGQQQGGDQGQQSGDQGQQSGDQSGQQGGDQSGQQGGDQGGQQGGNTGYDDGSNYNSGSGSGYDSGSYNEYSDNNANTVEDNAPVYYGDPSNSNNYVVSSTESAAGSVSSSLYNSSGMSAEDAKPNEWSDITLDEKTVQTGVTDFSSIKENTKVEDNGQWILYVGYALLGLSVLGILYFIIATIAHRNAVKKAERLERRRTSSASRSAAARMDERERYDEYEEAPRRRTSRYADEDEGYSRRSSRSDTGEVYVPRRAAKR